MSDAPSLYCFEELKTWDYELDGDFPFTPEEIETLRAIQSGEDIKSVVVSEIFEDDHEICVEVTVNGVTFAALWIVPEFLADIIYAGKGHSEGKGQLAQYIQSFIDV